MGETGKDEASPEAMKAAAEGLKKILDVLAPEPKSADSSTPGNVVDELYGAISSVEVADVAKQVATAAERYRHSMRWLVAAVAAVGTVLFASTAFTEVDLLADWRWVGLALASLGLVVVLGSALLMFEPEDASLGELAADFERVGTGSSWGRPRKRSLQQLKAIVEGPEKYAHIGHASVKDLIKSIDLQLRARQADPAANAQALRAAQSADPLQVHPDCAALSVARHRRIVAADTEMRKFVAERLKELLEYRAALVAANLPVEELDEHIVCVLGNDEELRRNSMTALTLLQDKVSALEIIDYQLGLDLLHRELLLAESAVAQLRGKFRLSTRTLLLGAAITLIGTLLYVGGIKSPSGEEDGIVVRAGTLTVSGDSQTADELWPECVDRPLNVLLFEKDFPAVGTSYTVTVTSPAKCSGDIKVPADREDDDVSLTLTDPVPVPVDD